MQLQADPLTYAPAIVANYVRLWYESGAGVQICGFPWSPSSEIFGSKFEAIFLRSMLELSFYWGASTGSQAGRTMFGLRVFLAQASVS